jgi:hypothetical protein
MGNNSSTVVDTPSDTSVEANTAQSGLLKWKRCVFMTQKQYASNSHINDKMLCITGTATDVDTYVTDKIKEVAAKLPNRKVPAPIYVMYAKKLEYDGTIFGDCVDEAIPYKNIVDQQKTTLMASMALIPQLMTAMTDLELKRNESVSISIQLSRITIFQPSNTAKIAELKNTIASLNKQAADFQENVNRINALIVTYKDDLKKLEDQKKAFKCINDENYEKYIVIADNIFQDMNALYSSELSKFNFNKNKNYQIIMYFPNLNADNFYFSNFKDYTLHNQWMYSFIKFDGLLYNIIPISDPIVGRLKRLYDDPRNQSNQKFKELIRNVIKIFVALFEKTYPFAKELTQSCFNKGCVSDYGEDFEQMIPGYTNDSGQRKLNSNSKAPYYPTKCLRQLNYKSNMFDDNDDFKKDMTKKLLGKCLDDYNDSKNNLDDSGKPPDKDVEPLLVDQMKKCSVQYRYEKIGNFNTDEGTDKYSVQYNQKILGELSLRKYSYPGIQEIIFPLFRLDENDASVSNYITYMPWGEKLLTSDYAINMDSDEKLEDQPLKSMDDVYKLIIPTKNVPPELLHKICIFKNNSIYYTLSDVSYSYCFNKKFRFENPGILNLYGSIIINDAPSEKLQWSMTGVDVSKAIQPVSLGFNPATGSLVAFDNGLNIVTSKSLTDRMEKSKAEFSGSDYKYSPENALASFEAYIRTLGYKLGFDSFKNWWGYSQSSGSGGDGGDGSGDGRTTMSDGRVVNRDGTTVFDSKPYTGITPSLLYDDDEEMRKELEKAHMILTDVRNKYFT